MDDARLLGYILVLQMERGDLIQAPSDRLAKPAAGIKRYAWTCYMG
jgi:hypothetical protein